MNTIHNRFEGMIIRVPFQGHHRWLSERLRWLQVAVDKPLYDPNSLKRPLIHINVRIRIEANEDINDIHHCLGVISMKIKSSYQRNLVSDKISHLGYDMSLYVVMALTNTSAMQDKHDAVKGMCVLYSFQKVSEQSVQGLFGDSTGGRAPGVDCW